MARKRYRRRRRGSSAFNNYLKALAQANATDYMADPTGTPKYGKKFRQMFGANMHGADPDQAALRKAVGYYGEGDYRKWLKWGSRGLGALAGGASGLMSGGLGGAVSGARSGYGSGANFSRWAGWGDYGPMSGNQLMGGSGSQQQISVNATDNSGDVFIQHTEFVTNVDVTIPAGANSTDFTLLSFPINPGLSRMFPFLSHLARNYVLYDFQGLMIQYKPTSGESSSATNNAIGKVILATQYDPDAPEFVNGVQMENYAYSNSTKPSAGAIHGVETAPGKAHMDMLYVRHGDVSKDLSFTDVGTFYIGTEGIPGNAGDNVHIGELWVTYLVRLSRPSVDNHLLGKSINTFQATWSGAVNDILSGAVTYDTENDMTIIISRVSATAVDIIFPEALDYGDFKIYSHVVFSGTDAGAVAYDPTAGNHSNVTFWAEGAGAIASPTTVQLLSPEAALASTTKTAIVYVNVDAPGTNQGIVRLTQPATGDNGAWEIKINKVQGYKRVIAI